MADSDKSESTKESETSKQNDQFAPLKMVQVTDSRPSKSPKDGK